MKGDFSKWEFNPLNNYTGVLHQQGRALLDQDWNASDQISRHLREIQGRDSIGPNVAAVPSELKDSFKVIEATTDGTMVEVTLHPGRVWVNGLLLQVSGTGPYTRSAEYLAPPIQDPKADPSTIAAGVRDAVILEAWEAAFNAFQAPKHLIESALGGVDTTERVKLFHDLKLLRLVEGENCDNIKDNLKDDFSAKGRLTVTAEEVTITGDCPVEAGGGYTGFEHFLFRIEIAQPGAGNNAQFKWSRFNGGLVGRGTYDSSLQEVTITANDQMINHSGLNNFYLEALQEDPNGGRWPVTFSANATLSSDGKLSLTNIAPGSTWPADALGRAFFRLWDGVKRIDEFSVGPNPDELMPGLGIRLQFEAPAANNSNYVPGDFWTFPVRAAGAVNFDPLTAWPQNEPPQGIRYHRVPLAILDWDADPTTTINAPDNITDCRRVFHPLAERDRCCTVSVGDGVHSKGDYDSIEEALASLPESGGQVCVLRGVHKANVVVEKRQNIRITGCGRNSKVIPRSTKSNETIFHIKDSVNVVLEQMEIASLENTAILLEGSDLGRLREVIIQHNWILACQEAIRISRGVSINIQYNDIRLLDKEGAGVAIYIMAEDSLIERNDISVIPAEKTPLIDQPGDEPSISPTDPCARLELIYTQPGYYESYIEPLWAISILDMRTPSYTALGGIQIAAGSERIKVLENNIKGGAGNGITLGTPIDLEELRERFGEGDSSKRFTVRSINDFILGYVIDENDKPLAGIELSFVESSGLTLSAVTDSDGGFRVIAKEGVYQITVSSSGYGIDRIQDINLGAGRLHVVKLVSKEEDDPEVDDPFGFIYDIDIERNEIHEMELAGIGSLQGGKYGNKTDVEEGFANKRLKYETGESYLNQEYRNRYGVLGLAGLFLSSFTVGLNIYRNRIHQCVKRTFSVPMRERAFFMGFGAINIGMTEGLCIRENGIESNGLSHLDPICGVLANGSNMEIADNRILNNGPIIGVLGTSRIAPGIRGAIFIRAFSTSTLSLLKSRLSKEKLTARDFTFALNALPAARIRDNVVHQPLGHSLVVVAMGPLSVVDNRFSTDLTGPGIVGNTRTDSGTVLIINQDRSGLSTVKQMTRIQKNADAKGYTIKRLSTGESISAAEGTGIEQVGITQLGGMAMTLFNSNQVRLGTAINTKYSVLIRVSGDVGFDGNQCSVELYDQALLSNTYVLGNTIRAGDSVFKELFAYRGGSATGIVANVEKQPIRASIYEEYGYYSETAPAALQFQTPRPLSLLTKSLQLNNTSNNQGDHCIIALPLPVPDSNYPTVYSGNQMQNIAQCAEFGKSISGYNKTIVHNVLKLLQ